MNNYRQPGVVLTLTAPAGGVTAGSVYVIGGLAVIAAADASASAEFEGQVTGVFELTKASGTAWTEGQAVYWDAANSRADVSPSVGPAIGAAAAAAASAATVGDVRLNGTSVAGPGCYQVRKRFTIAEVNAGATIVAAVPRHQIRMVDAIAISVGGAAGAVTTVDILGTSTSSRKLVAFAQASLTQSTVLRAGGSGAAVLADGASFTANDTNTAITIGITGSDVTTATHIDVIFTYALDAV